MYHRTVLFVEAFLLPSSVRNSPIAYYEDMSSSLQQAVYNAHQPHLVGRNMSPKMGYMLGNPGLAARQEDPNAEEDPAVDEEETTTTTRRRPTTSRASATRTVDPDDEEPITTTRRSRPTATPTDDENEDVPRETKTSRPKRKVVNACAWSRMIKGTNTTPLWSVLHSLLFCQSYCISCLTSFCVHQAYARLECRCYCRYPSKFSSSILCLISLNTQC